MIDLAHEEVHLLLALLAFANVRDGADDARARSLRPVALEISEPMRLSPMDLAVSRLNSELDRIRLPLPGIARRLEGRPNPFRIVRMHKLRDLFESRPILSNI